MNTWKSRWPPNREQSEFMRDLHAYIRAELVTERTYRPEDGRYLTGGRRMNARQFRAWRRLLARSARKAAA